MCLECLATVVVPDITEQRLCCAWAEQCGEEKDIEGLIIALPPHPGHGALRDAGTGNDL